MIDAGKYDKKIQIIEIADGEDSDGFPTHTESVISEPYAEVHTTKGYTLIASGSDFEKATTNFTIRYSNTVVNRYEANNRNLQIKFKNKYYTIEYLNNIDEANVELEMQCKVVKK